MCRSTEDSRERQDLAPCKDSAALRYCWKFVVTAGSGLCCLFWSLRWAVVVAVVQLLSRVRLSATPWTAAPRQASLTFTISRSLLKLMSIESVTPSNHLILCRPLLLPSVFPSLRTVVLLLIWTWK